jgi:membrane protease YdiL (CAAX protease family)
MKNKILTILLLIFLLVIWPLLSYLVMSSSQVELKTQITSRATQIYLPTILIELLVLLLIILALHKGNENLKAIGFVGFNLKNLLVGIGFLGLAYLFLSGIAFLLQMLNLKSQEDISFLLPYSGIDKIFWVIMSLVAGICEEAGFRGFVLTKLNFWIKNWWLTSLVSSVFFGLGHLYQGVGGLILTGIYGFLFCLLFIWRKSLFPGIVAHTLQDVMALFASL